MFSPNDQELALEKLIQRLFHLLFLYLREIIFIIEFRKNSNIPPQSLGEVR